MKKQELIKILINDLSFQIIKNHFLFFEEVELLKEYTDRLNVINEFAPVLITDNGEIKNMITTLLSENQVELLKSNRGQIMKIVMPAMKGKADMKIVNKVIGELLQ